MIEKISYLKSKVDSNEVKKLCEDAISIISSTIYNGVTNEAKVEIEKITISNLFEQLLKYKNIKEVNEWIKNEKRLFTIKHLGIRDAINSLNESDELKYVLEQFKDALNKGVHEARLYEQFITALSPFGYFPTVGNAIKAVKDRVDTYKTDVDIIKIIETMKETRSNYLVPLIEDVVNNYLSNKNAQTKHQLSETLIKFTYDPFVRDIASLLTLDATELQLEYANAQCDIEKVYSPILYIGENEAVFSVNKQYYIKKGNNISHLSNVEVLKLDNEFKTLCETLSNPNIVVEKGGITVYFGNDKAFISDKGVVVNEQLMNNEQFKNAESVSLWGGNRGFYQLVEFLRSNFNEIAEIDFVKSVYLKENENHNADVFKLRDNVFITTHDSELDKTTFYRNINPIQAKNIMMEHLRFDVTSIYNNILPDEEKIYKEINETKKEYNDYIYELQNRITEFNLNPYGKEINEKVVEALEEELSEIKNEYKDYLNHIEKYIRAESVNEDISIDINVDGKKYTVPIPQEVNGNNKEKDNQQAGVEVGKEAIEDKPASAVTFDTDQTELLTDTPTIPEDKIDMGSEEAEEEATDAEEKAEKEAEEKKDDEEKDKDENEDDIKIEDEVDSEEEDKDELKAEDDEEEDKEKEDKKKQKLESSEGTGLTKKKFIKESGDIKKKKKVFLKKKVTEGNKNNQEKPKNVETDKPKDKTQIKENLNIKKKSKINESLNENAQIGDYIVTILTKQQLAKYENIPLTSYSYSDIINNAGYHIKVSSEIEAEKLKKKYKDLGFYNEEEINDIIITNAKVGMGKFNYNTNESLNENAQIGDAVTFNKQNGFIIGQIGDDLLVQVQGCSHMAKQKDVKVKNIKVETLKPPFKFDKQTQKLLFEQYVKCGIFMDNIPIKTNNCYVRFSDWKESSDIDPINVIVEGQLSILPKNRIKIFEDVNDFANLDNYVEGVELNEIGDIISNVQINAKDYTEALGDADPVRIIRSGDTKEPTVDTAPKELLRTLSI